MTDSVRRDDVNDNDGALALLDSRYAWWRLAIALVLMTIGGASMYAIVVVLPAVQADFGVDRSGASLPYTMLLLGFGVGGILMGRMADRFGVGVPLVFGSTMLGVGGVVASWSGSIWQFALANGVLIGALGSSCTFGPLVSDVSFWFRRQRGMAVAICASGNYLAGVVWPPVVQHYVESAGWRQTYAGIGLFCLATMVPLSLLLRRRPPDALLSAAASPAPGAGATAVSSLAALERPMGLSRERLFALLIIAGIACCVAMAMPQVHIVAFCGDLGYGPARGAQMLSLMLACGIVSRLVSGWICDRIGGLRTLLLGSVLQGVALLLFLPSDGLVALYVASALFGLFQGGIVPSYAIIVRDFFPGREAGTRVSMVLMATLLGMALGGWLSGKVFDLTGSYHAAFLNGIAWNLLNGAIALWLLLRQRRWLRGGPLAAAA